jgi:hypothetical protein
MRREREPWIVFAQGKETKEKHNGDHPPMARMTSMKGIHGPEARTSKRLSGCLELANPASVRLVHARPGKVALLEEDARTKVRGHGAVEVGIIRDRQRL